MPWIRTVSAEEATGPLKEFFERHKIERGRMFTPYEVFTNNAGARSNPRRSSARTWRISDGPGSRKRPYEHLAAEGAS